MKAYVALIRINLRLAMREKSVLFFNYFFPLLFFFGFGQFMGARAGGTLTRVISMVLVIGVLGSGLFGAGMRTVMERETGILRRYKVTPISPLPLLVSNIVVGWLLYMPSAAIILALSHFVYGMPWPERPLSLLLLISIGSWAFRAIGLIIASVANSIAESNILIQSLYMPMLFVSGATIPISAMPLYMQIAAQFLPASYLTTGLQRVLLRAESIGAVAVPVLAMLASTAISLFISVKLFRWEKEEKIGGKAKLWVLGVMLPFVGMGVWQGYSKDHINETKLLDREIRRANPRLIRGARIFVGDGKVIENGSVLVKGSRIVEVYESSATPDPDRIGADVIEAAGKTLLPGLVDVHVHLGSPGGVVDKPETYDYEKGMERALEAYLYAGVTAVKSTGDFTDAALLLRERFNGGQKAGAEFFLTGPLFTTEGGHGTEYFKNAPEWLKKVSADQFTRTPATPDEARRQVEALKAKRVDGIKAVLESGIPGMLFQRMDLSILRAVAEASRAAKLPLTVHTGDSRDVADAVDAGANGIEHGSSRTAIPDILFEKMKAAGIVYDPTLTVVEAFTSIRNGDASALDRSLVEQVAPPGMIAATRKQLVQPDDRMKKLSLYPADIRTAGDNLLRAWKAGVPLATGTDSGNLLLLHGPAIHRELQLWVAAGVPPSAALQAATSGGAKLLRAEQRFGLIRKGLEANLIVVDGNPLQDISVTERISAVLFKGERVDRQGLFEQK